MRLVHYGAFNKETNTCIYIDCRKHKVEEYIANLPNGDQYEIRYKWVSI